MLDKQPTDWFLLFWLYLLERKATIRVLHIRCHKKSLLVLYSSMGHSIILIIRSGHVCELWLLLLLFSEPAAK